MLNLVWLIPLASLIFTIIYWRRSRRKKPENDSAAIIQAIYVATFTAMAIEITVLGILLALVITLLLDSRELLLKVIELLS